MKKLIKKVKELEDIANSNVTHVKVGGGDERLGTDGDTLELIRDEFSKFMDWLYDFCGDREDLLKQSGKVRNITKKGVINLKREMPLPVTVGDCLLVNQMGYDVEVNDGQVKKLVKKEREAKI